MRTIVINNPGPQGSTGPQGVAGPSGSTQPFNNVSGSIWATTSSLQVSGSFLVSGSSTFTNIGPAIFSGSATITGATTMSSAVVSGDVTVLGTASINVLQINTTINSTGSNTLGDNVSDTQTLYGTVVIPTGSLVVSGNVSFGTSSAGFLWNNTSNTLTVNNKLSVFSNASGTFLYSNEELFVGSSVNRRLAFFVNSLEAMRIADTTRNILIGTTTDAGYKLDVNGTARVSGTTTITPATLTGSAATSALDISQTWNTTGTPTAIKLNITNTASQNVSKLLDLQVGGSTQFNVDRNGIVNIQTRVSFNQLSSNIIWPTTGGNSLANNLIDFRAGGSYVATSGNLRNINVEFSFTPTSGNATLTGFNFAPTINQTGGANGITRGLYINPTLTSVADFRAIEVTSGSVVFGSTGSGFYWDSTNNRLGIKKTPVVEIDVTGDIRSSGYMFNTVTQTNNIQTNGGNLSIKITGGVTAATVHQTTGNVLIGTTTDSGRLTVRGSGTTSATTALRVENTNASASLVVLDNGFVGINTGSAQYNLDVNGTARISSTLTIGSNIAGVNINTYTQAIGGFYRTGAATEGLEIGRNSGTTMNLFSGTANLKVYNNTGVGVNTTSLDTSAVLQADSTTSGFLIPRMTTTQRDAISSPATGLQIFNNTEGYIEYYDSFWGWMPVANQNEWKRKWGSEYFNDFGVNNGFAGDGVFQTFPINGGSYMSFNPLPLASDYIGFMGLSTGVNSNGQNAIRTDLNVGIFFRPAFRISLISRLWLQTLSDATNRYNVIFGLSQGANSTVNNGCAFIYDEGGVGTGTTASPNWQIITANGSVRTNFVTSVVVATSTWYSFRIESNSTFTEIKYYINDTLVLTETTNIPTGISTQPVVSITKTAGTTNRAIAVDYLGLKVKLNSAR